uniref:cAMP-regulated phosphoprotein 19a n=1 Tax=Acanthochromis polyacanthus TaxID=80966 RepID=A0A3Q1GRI7_9TELE
MQENISPPKLPEAASYFLRKRLQKGQKYFDSGDHNMAKAKMKNKQSKTAPTEKMEITRDHIPTVQDLPQRKTSIVEG